MAQVVVTVAAVADYDPVRAWQVVQTTRAHATTAALANVARLFLSQKAS